MPNGGKLIEIWSEPLPKGWEWHPTKFVGGTPEYVVETAGCLAKRGYDVFVYYDGEPTEHNGVYYLPRSQYQGLDVVLACNGKPPHMGKKNIYWSSHVHNKDHEFAEFDERIVLSKYHQGLFGENSVIIPLACWPDKFKGGKKIAKQCLYSSSPDRGGEVVNKVWQEVFDATGATLVTTYTKIISEEIMEELYKESQFWLHPCTGVELFCISGYKAMAAGCIPVYVPNMALAETIRFGVKTTTEQFAKDLINAIQNTPECPTIDLLDWDDVSDLLEQLWT